MFKVKFVVKSKPRRTEQAIRVVGNLAALGNWNPLHGLLLEEYYDGEWESVQQIQLANGNPLITQGRSSSSRS
jgi:hypothetical protein